MAMARADVEFDLFFAEHYPRVCRALWLSLGSHDQGVEDAAQGAFAKAFQKWRAVSRLNRPATWVYVVAFREATRQNRRKNRVVRPTLVQEATREDGSAELDVRLTVAAALDRLPPRQRIATVLRFYGDLTNRDIAKAMRCSEGTVKATVHAGLENLRSLLETREVDDER
jgi:RNA polymerase sigma factor (sigma-70 family)